MKRCPRCKTSKPLPEFYPDTSKKGGRRSACIPCELLYSKGRLEKRRDVCRRIRLNYEYGITVETYEEMLSAQEGVCALCSRPPKTKRLAVDHLHIPGYKKMLPDEKKKYVRGLLCSQCNQFLIGKNTLDSARKVVYYLEKFEERKCSGS